MSVAIPVCRIHIPIASGWRRDLYPHEKPTLPVLWLNEDSEEWHCDDCGREGRLLRVNENGMVMCPRCMSRFVTPVSEL